VQERDGLDAAVVAGLLFVAATLWAAWRQRVKRPLVAFCILAYWCMYGTTSVAIPFHHLAVDYRPYPSSVFLFLGLALLACEALDARARRLAFVASVAWASGCSAWMNLAWRNDWTLWHHSVEHGGGSLAYLGEVSSLG
jgi:hypothetical protein